MNIEPEDIEEPSIETEQIDKKNASHAFAMRSVIS